MGILLASLASVDIRQFSLSRWSSFRGVSNAPQPGMAGPCRCCPRSGVFHFDLCLDGKDHYCLNASVRLQMQERDRTGRFALFQDTRQGGVVQADIPCDSRAFGRSSTCCHAEDTISLSCCALQDVTMVMDHLQHSISFGMRHLTDRKESGHLISTEKSEPKRGS